MSPKYWLGRESTEHNSWLPLLVGVTLISWNKYDGWHIKMISKGVPWTTGDPLVLLKARVARFWFPYTPSTILFIYSWMIDPFIYSHQMSTFYVAGIVLQVQQSSPQSHSWSNKERLINPYLLYRSINAIKKKTMVCTVQRMGKKDILFPGKLTKNIIMNPPGEGGKSKGKAQKY